MHKDNHQSPLAVSYAQALLQLANESKTAQEIGEELRGVRQIVDTTPVFAQVLANPVISADEHGKLIASVFEGRISKLLYNFLCVLNEKGRLQLLTSIAGDYDDLLDEQYGKVEVDVTVAERLDDAQMETVSRKIKDALKRDAVVHQYVDESIIGGLILRVQDQLIDGSVRAQLQNMRQRLLSARPVL